MAVSIDSRYTADQIVRTSERGTTRSIIVQSPPTIQVLDFTYYQWSEGDRIDRVAEDFFDNGTLWYVIADANPEILTWADVPVGTVIRIPNG